MHLTVVINQEDIMIALNERQIKPTQKNLDKLRQQLQGIARDSANTFLVDFVRNKLSLEYEVLEDDNT